MTIMALTPSAPSVSRLRALRAALESVGTRTIRRDRHARVEPLSAIRVVTHLGAGVLVSVTDDAWCEVRLDGEARVDEYPVASVDLAAQ